MCSLFSQKVPVNELLKFPLYRAPMERAARLQGLFYISLKFLIKIPLNKAIYPFSQRTQEMSVLPCSPKAGPLWKQTSISRALLSISFGFTSKLAHPPGFPHRALSERDAPFLESYFIHLSTSPVYEPPSRFPSGAPMERCPSPELSFTHPPRSPVKNPPSRFP